MFQLPPINLELPAILALIFGGLGLFLFGITFLSTNLKSVANGDTFRRVVSKATDNRVKAAGLGIGFTALIQSSGGTSALSIGLVKAGSLNYRSAIAIIIGANVGTCITAFLIAIPSISMFMPFLTFISALAMMLIKNRKVQVASKMLFSFSLIFFGIWLIETFVKASIKDQAWFENLIQFLDDTPWLGLLFGTGITLALQSSSAVIGVVQGIYAATVVAGSSSSITLFGILPLVIGANIGAVIPSILSAVGGSTMAKRVAFTNTFMKVVAALLFMGLLYALQGPLLTSYTWPIDPKLQIALAHLIFNLGSLILFLPLLDPLVKLSEIVIKEKKTVGAKIEFTELDPKVIKTFPSTGISLAADLAAKMFGYALNMFESMEKYMTDFDEETYEYIKNLENAIDHIDRHLSSFLLKAETGTLTYSDQLRYNRILRAIKDIERIGDYGDNISEFFNTMNNKKEVFNDFQKEELFTSNKQAINLIKLTMQACSSATKIDAYTVIQNRRDYIAKLTDYQNAYFERAINNKDKGDDSKRTYLSLVYVDILNAYERVYSHCSNIAKLYHNDKDVSKKSSDSDKKRFEEMSSRY